MLNFHPIRIAKKTSEEERDELDGKEGKEEDSGSLIHRDQNRLLNQ